MTTTTLTRPSGRRSRRGGSISPIGRELRGARQDRPWLDPRSRTPCPSMSLPRRNPGAGNGCWQAVARTYPGRRASRAARFSNRSSLVASRSNGGRQMIRGVVQVIATRTSSRRRGAVPPGTRRTAGPAAPAPSCGPAGTKALGRSPADGRHRSAVCVWLHPVTDRQGITRAACGPHRHLRIMHMPGDMRRLISPILSDAARPPGLFPSGATRPPGGDRGPCRRDPPAMVARGTSSCSPREV